MTSTPTPICVTIQRGVTGNIADTQIASNQPEKSFGHMPIANIGISGGGERQSLVRAELSAIPTPAIIESATLTLWQSNTGRAVVNAHRVLAPWDEHTATWNRVGGAFAPEIVTSADNGGSAYEGAIDFDITELAQAWVSGTSPNYGLVLRQESESATRIRTGKVGNTQHRPRLEVCYTPAEPPEGTSLFVQVLDTAGQPVHAAAVTVGGALHATNGAGQILFENLAPGRFTARVEARGYAPASIAVDLPAGTSGGIEARLMPLGEPIPFNADTGAIIEQEAVRVHIPPGSLVDFRGEPVTGTVEATVVPLDPTTAHPADLPGPLEGITEGTGEAVSLESLAMAEVSLWQGGLPVQLAPGATAMLELRLADSLAARYQIGDTIPAWWLDLDAGLWRQEGAGTIQHASSDPDKLAWVVTVSHFTWWNSDRPWTEKNCFAVTVVDADGNPVPQVQVGATGISYTGQSWTSYTQGDGEACVDIMLGGMAEIYVGNRSLPMTAPMIVLGSGPASDCAGNGMECMPVLVALPENPVICTPGASLPCAYSGPAGTEGVGLCRAGVNYCNADGTAWLGCQGEILPAAETCSTPFDDDCDGEANEPDGLNCECGAGDTVACYTGPADTLGVGLCQAGARACDTSIGRYGACEGQVVPQPERCDPIGEDEDCDGAAIGTLWPGNFEAWTQAQLEQLRGCSGVDGSLGIWSETGDSGFITDWTALDSLESVGSLLWIENETLPTSAFPLLATVGGVYLSGVDFLGSHAFPALTSIRGWLWTENMSSDIVEGFPVLQSVSSGIGLYGLEMDELSGFGSLTTLPTLSIGAEHVRHWRGFQNLGTTGSIWFEGGRIDDLSAFHGAGVLGSLNIEGARIGRFHGLTAISETGAIEIWNSHLGELSGFDSLVSVKEYFYIRGGSMRVLADFPSLARSITFMTLSRVDGLQEISGFRNLPHVGYLKIEDNPSLERIRGFDNLRGTQDLSIQRNNSLLEIPSFDAMEYAQSVQVKWNANLLGIAGFRNLTGVDKGFSIANNASLQSLVGFDRFAGGGEFAVLENPYLDECYIDRLKSIFLANGASLAEFYSRGNGTAGGDGCANLP